MPARPTDRHEALALALSIRRQRKEHDFGEYPLVPPHQARDLHFAAKQLLRTGPMAERKAEAEAKQEEIRAIQREADSCFEKVARKWWAWWSIGKSPRHAETLMNRLEADVFPVIGHLSIDAVAAIERGEIASVSCALSDAWRRAQLVEEIKAGAVAMARLRPFED